MMNRSDSGSDLQAWQKMACGNAIRSYEVGRQLPDMVLTGTWDGLFFFQSDYIFSPEFVAVNRSFLRAERSHVSCLLNIDRTNRLEFWEAATLYLDNESDEQSYIDALKLGGPASGWLYGVDCYICASDLGNWCIYAERSNDVALVGIRHQCDIRRFDDSLYMLNAKKIEELIDCNSTQFPFGKLVQTWRLGLLANYGHGASL